VPGRIAIKQGVIRIATKPTPIIHVCIEKTLSFIVNRLNYSENHFKIALKK